MINLRYHIVSLTAVFLAIGIGLTLGSTFLDRATVENLQGQLQNLETRLGDRDEQIGDLQSQLERSEALQAALDEQGASVLAGRLDPVPVLVIAAAGVDDADVDGAVDALAVAGADVQGRWWLSERFLLGGEGDVRDLANALGETSTDPARLRRVAVAALADELRERQDQELERVPGAEDDVPATPGEGGEVGEEEGTGAGPAAPDVAGPVAEAPSDDVTDADDADEPQDLGTLQALIDSGFVVFDPVPGGPEVPAVPAGVRLVLVGGSSVVPDDLVIRPLLTRLTQGRDEPSATVVTSAMGEVGVVSEIVASVREDDELRSLVSTVDGLDHFQGWVATVLAVQDLADGVVGHYGLGDGAASLLPPLRGP
jgi:hypothetical protein